MSKNNQQNLFESAARDHFPDDTNRSTQFMARLERESKPAIPQGFHQRVWVALGVVVILAVMALAAPYAVQAMQRLLGYLPGVGLVEDGAQFLIVVDAQREAHGGIAVEVQKGSADTQRIVLLIEVTGIDHGTYVQNCADSEPYLVTEDDEVLALLQASGHGTDAGYVQRLIFDPLPGGERSVNLVLPCLMPAGVGQPPNDWVQTISFTPAPADSLAEVIELPPPPAANQEPTQPTGAQVTAMTQPSATPGIPYGIELTLERVVELEDGYIWMGKVTWTDPKIQPYGVEINHVRVTDASGVEVESQIMPPDTLSEADTRSMNWAYKIFGKTHNWPLDLTAGIGVNFQPNASFTFDAGPAPQAGQTWDINQVVPLLDTTITVLDATYDVDSEGNGALQIRYSSSGDVLRLFLQDTNSPATGGGGGGVTGAPVPNEPQITTVYYIGEMPSGQTIIQVISATLLIDGPWQLTWQP